MLLFIPLTLLLLLMLYLVLVKILYPNNIEHSKEAAASIRDARKQLGPMSSPEKRVLLIFSFAIFLWITKDFFNKTQAYVVLDDTMVALLATLLLFLIPSGNKEVITMPRLMMWTDARSMAWDVLLLFGGGIALANALEDSGLVNEIARGLSGYTTDNMFVLILVVTTISVFLSEVISNIAMVIILSPLVTSMALNLKIDPLLLGIPMTLGASCACMLPMGTPPNAIVFAKGHIKMRHMIRTGLVLNLICILLITVFCWFLLPKTLNISP
jgi:sodium-dependent dicarboxylate transporter 2/3/5